MGSRKRKVDELLLDLHLNRVSQEDRDWLEAELERDAGMREKSDRLGRLLQPLDHWSVAPAPGNLIDVVLARIQSEAENSPPRDSDRSLASGGDRGRRVLPLPRMRNFVAVAACLLLIVGVFVPGITELRHRSRRAVCASNLASIYRGLSAYQASFAGVLPFAGGSDGSSWLPGGDADRLYASNSRHPFLLVKLNLGAEPNHFVCPSAADSVRMDLADATGRDDFLLARNMSYDSQNLSGRAPTLRPVKTTAYVGDRNPLFVNARFDASVDPSTANSPAHRRRGQTILTLDGRAEFLNAPAYGPRSDNPWILGDLRRYNGTESELSIDDAFLVPGYPVSDPEVAKKLGR